MSMKQAAEQLLKIADEIEKEASEVTNFVCNKCNHTATLATINAKRKEAAKAAGEGVVGSVADITVNDKVHCPACDGVMAYQETEASKPYYIDETKQAKSEEKTEEKTEEKEKEKDAAKEKEEEKKKEKTASTPIDYDSLNRYLGK